MCKFIMRFYAFFHYLLNNKKILLGYLIEPIFIFFIISNNHTYKFGYSNSQNSIFTLGDLNYVTAYS